MSTPDCLMRIHTSLSHPGVTRMHFVRSKNLPYSTEDVKKTCSSCRRLAWSLNHSFTDHSLQFLSKRHNRWNGSVSILKDLYQQHLVMRICWLRWTNIHVSRLRFPVRTCIPRQLSNVWTKYLLFVVYQVTYTLTVVLRSFHRNSRSTYLNEE